MFTGGSGRVDEAAILDGLCKYVLVHLQSLSTFICQILQHGMTFMHEK